MKQFIGQWNFAGEDREWMVTLFVPYTVIYAFSIESKNKGKKIQKGQKRIENFFQQIKIMSSILRTCITYYIPVQTDFKRYV
jgi:hypothetical protein